MARWQLPGAKQRFSKLVDLARSEGPQALARHGREVVVESSSFSTREWPRRSTLRRPETFT